MQAKKSMLGAQAVPTFDAKGIETVRRDTCGAVAKMMERSLRILFSTKDLSQVLPHLDVYRAQCRGTLFASPGPSLCRSN